MWARREVVLGGALSLLAMNCPTCGTHAAPSSRTPNTRGCCLADQDVEAVYPRGTDTRLFMNGNEPMIPRSGDRDFDYALAQTLSKITDTFGVLPGFAYYDDYDGLNAYATPNVRLRQADGTVLFGQQLLGKLKSGQDHPAIVIAGVCAHEFGHILQFKRGLHARLQAGQPTVKRTELQADFFSGYFAGRRKKERPDFPAAVVAQGAYNVGDTHVNDRGHHGLPDERARAVVAGFKAAYNDNKSMEEAITVSTSYVMSL